MNRIKNKISKIKNQSLIFLHLIKGLTFKKRTKTKLIICFDGSVSHGGLLDRLKGVVSFFEIAKLKGHDFQIVFNHPFDLSQYLEVNTYNWMGENSTFNPFTDKIYYLMNQFTFNPNVQHFDKKCNYFIYCNLDYLPKIHPDKNQNELEFLWRENFNLLFKKSFFLEKEIQNLPNEKRIVCHTRFTSLMGDFKDTTSKSLSANEQISLQNKILSKLEEIKNENQNLPIYVLSDSVNFLKFIEKNNTFKVLKGEPKHIDVNSFRESIHADLKTFTDFYFISESEKVYLIKIDEMYPSGFSKYAAILGNKNFEMISN